MYRVTLRAADGRELTLDVATTADTAYAAESSALRIALRDYGACDWMVVGTDLPGEWSP